jgi:hypothetical protein
VGGSFGGRLVWWLSEWVVVVAGCRGGGDGSDDGGDFRGGGGDHVEKGSEAFRQTQCGFDAKKVAPVL